MYTKETIEKLNTALDEMNQRMDRYYATANTHVGHSQGIIERVARKRLDSHLNTLGDSLTKALNTNP